MPGGKDWAMSMNIRASRGRLGWTKRIRARRRRWRNMIGIGARRGVWGEEV